MTPHFFTIALCLSLALPAWSAPPRPDNGSGAAADTLAHTPTTVVADHLGILHGLSGSRSGSPALKPWQHAASYSEVGLDADYEKANQPLLYQTGSGHTFGRFRADAYLRLSPRTTVWGEASYRTGRVRAVKWNSTADFLLLYPYVMADTIGGDLNSERYTFSGGWAARKGRWTVGAEVRFRAEHEYRTRDPRPRSIVTDLTAGVGLAGCVGRYTVGVNAGGRFYKQTNSVAFYREEGVVPEYQMTGLGMDYKRFSGSNRSAYYKGTGWTAGLDALPAGRSGPYLSAAFGATPYRRILTQLNALPVTTLYDSRLELEAGWKLRGRQCRLEVFAGVDGDWRDGDEHVAGSSSSTEYDIVETLTMYHAHDLTWQAGVRAQLARGRDTWNFVLRASWVDYEARYVFPARRMSWHKAGGEAEAQWLHNFRKGRLLTLHATAAGQANVERAIEMPYATMGPADTDLVDHTYDNATAGYGRVALSARIDTPLRLKGVRGLFAEAGGSWRGNGGYGASAFTVAAGLTF